MRPLVNETSNWSKRLVNETNNERYAHAHTHPTRAHSSHLVRRRAAGDMRTPILATECGRGKGSREGGGALQPPGTPPDRGRRRRCRARRGAGRGRGAGRRGPWTRCRPPAVTSRDVKAAAVTSRYVTVDSNNEFSTALQRGGMIRQFQRVPRSAYVAVVCEP